jgi:hypothetical protein
MGGYVFVSGGGESPIDRYSQKIWIKANGQHSYGHRQIESTDQVRQKLEG